MNKDIEKIVDEIKINIEIAKVNDKPLIAEVSPNEKSKLYIANLIETHVNKTCIKFLQSFALYYHEEYGEQLIKGSIDEFLNHIYKSTKYQENIESKLNNR